MHHTSLTAQIQCCKWCEWLETISNGLCSNVSNVVVCTPQHTQTYIQLTHTLHIIHHTSLTAQIQCCKWCEWLETITNGLCSNVSNAVSCTSQHPKMHSINAYNQQTHTSLTTQIQCCKWCKWLETIPNGLCSNVSNLVFCTSQHTITQTHSINAYNPHNQHTSAHTTHHSLLKISVVSDVSDLRPSPMDCAPTCPMLLPVHPTHTQTHSINAYNQHTQTHHTSQHHSPLKSSVVSDVSDLRPSPMDCAPMSPMLLPVHPNTHNHTNTFHQYYITQHSQCVLCIWDIIFYNHWRFYSF